MSFALLLPLYLAGAAAIAAPLWVHFRQRQTAQPYDFSTLRFLMQSQIISSRRRRLLHLLLLLLRTAVILALVIGFARLWMGEELEPADRATVVVVDVSASMRGDAVWDQALARAHTVVEEAGPNTAVLTMGRWPKVVRGLDDEDYTAAQAAATVKPTYESGDAEAALRRAGELLEAAHANDKRIIIVSDFAQPAWAAVRWNQPLPAGVRVETARVAEDASDNLAVVSIQTPRTFWEPDEPLTIDATVRHFAAEPLPTPAATVAVPLRLTANARGQVTELEQTVRVPINGQATTQFVVNPGELRDLSGEVRLIDADTVLPADDAAFFHVPALRALRVGRLKHPDTDDNFLRMAVTPELVGQSGSTSTEIQATPYRLQPFEADGEFDALIIDHGLTLNEASRTAVAAHLESGRPVLLIVGRHARGQEAWDSELLGVWGGRRGQIRRTPSALLAGGNTASGFGQIDLQHPILQPFAVPRSGDLFAVEMHRWRALDASTLQPLLRMANGDTVMGVASVGGARLAAVGFDLDRDASAWPIDSTFLPMIHQTLAWLTGRSDATADMQVGDRNADGEPYDRPGVFDGKVVVLDVAESDPRRYTIDTFDRLTPPVSPDDMPTDHRSTTSQNMAALQAQGRGQDITPWLLLFAAMAAGAELWLGNRLSHG